MIHGIFSMIKIEKMKCYKFIKHIKDSKQLGQGIVNKKDVSDKDKQDWNFFTLIYLSVSEQASDHIEKHWKFTLGTRNQMKRLRIS